MTSSDKAASAKTPDVHVAAIAEPTAAMVAAFLAGASLGVSIAYALIGNNTVAAYLAGLCSAIGQAFAWKLAESHKKIADALIARLLQDEHAKAKREFASQLRALQAATADDWNAETIPIRLHVSFAGVSVSATSNTIRINLLIASGCPRQFLAHDHRRLHLCEERSQRRDPFQ